MGKGGNPNLFFFSLSAKTITQRGGMCYIVIANLITPSTHSNISRARLGKAKLGSARSGAAR